MSIVVDKLNNQRSSMLNAERSVPNVQDLIPNEPLLSREKSEVLALDRPALSTQRSTTIDATRDFIRRIMPPWAYGISSVWHLITAGILTLGKFSDATNKTWTRYATGFTKAVNSLVYADLAREALNKGFAFEFLGRVAEPVMNMFVDLNHYHLFRAFSSALNQLHSINLPRVKQGTPLWQNFIDNLEASKNIFMEVWTNRGGKINEKFAGGPKDKGHTLALASHVQILVGALALLNGIKRNMANRVLGVARNVAGVIADIGLLFEKDFSARRVGILYLAHAVGDTIKRFLPNKLQDVVDNAIMPLYNAAMYYFGLMGRRQNDGVYKMHDAPHDIHLEVVDKSSKESVSNNPALAMAA